MSGAQLQLPANFARRINRLPEKQKEWYQQRFITAYKSATLVEIARTGIFVARAFFLCDREIYWMQIGDRILGNVYAKLGNHLKDADCDNPFVWGLRFNEKIPDHQRKCRVHADPRFPSQIGLRITPRTAYATGSGWRGESLEARVTPVER